MPIIDCTSPATLTGYTGVDACYQAGGVQALYFTEYDSVNWSSCTISSDVLTAYVMNSGGVFVKVNTDPRNTFYNATYSNEAEVYDILLTGWFKTNTTAQRDSLFSMFGKCLVCHMILNNCSERVIGVDLRGATAADFEVAPLPLQVLRHLDSSGQVGQSKARLEVDWGCEQWNPPIFSTVGESSIPT